MTALEFYLFIGAFVLYALGGVSFVIHFLFRDRGFDRYGAILNVAGFVSHTFALVVRTNVTGYAPMTNMYESLSFFSWSTVGVLLIVRYVMKMEFAESFTAPV